MYKIINTFLLLICFTKFSLAQSDTIFTLNKTIEATIRELGLYEVRYTIPGNEAMYIVLQKHLIHKIKFADGHQIILDSTLQIHPIVNTDTSFSIVQTHHAQETEGLVLVAEEVVPVPNDYYYTITKRPDYENIKALAKLFGAQVVYFPENGLSKESYIDGDGYKQEIFSVKVKMYATALRDYSIIGSMITLHKEYKCKLIIPSADNKREYAKTRDAIISIDKIIIKNNLWSAKVKIEYNSNFYTTELLRLVYFDGDKMIGEYLNENKKKRTIILNYIQPIEPETKRKILGIF